MLQYPYGRVVLKAIQMDSTIFRMDTNTYSQALARYIGTKIDESEKSKSEIARESGIPWTSFCRKLEHPTAYFFTVPETIAVCESLGIGFIATLQTVEALASKEGGQ